MLLEGKVYEGPISLANGAPAEARFVKNRSIAMVQGQGRYQDAVLRGRCFVGGTAATGVAPGTAIGTTAAFSLFNPAGSGVNLVLLKVSMGYVSGTLGAGLVHFLANTNVAAAAVTGTAITAVNCLLGSGYASGGKPLTTATLPATPTVMRPFCSLDASLASSVVGPWKMEEDVDGEIVIMPGCCLSLHATAAGGATPLVCYGAMWEDVPA